MNSELFVWNTRIGDRVDVIYNRSAGKCAIGLIIDRIYPNILKIEYYNRFEEKINITVDITELPSFVDIKKLNTLTPYHRYLTNREFAQCINNNPKLTAKCRICYKLCCTVCAVFKCKWELYDEYQCEICTIKAEYNRIFEALYDLLSNKNDIRKSVYFDQNVIHILTKYSMGISMDCNYCKSEIVSNNQYDFEMNINQNGTMFHQYLISQDNLRKKDEKNVNIMYGQKRRIFCEHCYILMSETEKCVHIIGQCMNLEISKEIGLCMNHPFCSRCDKRLNYFLPSKCKGCFKSICRDNPKCAKYGYCTICWKR